MINGRASDLHYDELKLHINDDGRIAQSLRKLSKLRSCLFASEGNK